MDIFLTIAFWVVQAALAGLGAWVSVKTPKERKHVAVVIVAFLVLAGAGGGINIWQQMRASRSRQALKEQLDAIQRNTERPPKVEVTNNVPAPTVIIDNPGQVTKPFHIRVTKFEFLDPRQGTLGMNIYFENDGDVSGEFSAVGLTFYTDRVPDLTTDSGRKVEKRVEDQLMSYMDRGLKDAPEIRMEAHESRMVAFASGQGAGSGGKLTAVEIGKLESHNAVASTVGIFQYRSGDKTLQTRVCMFWNTGPQAIICLNHDDVGDQIIKEQ